MESKWISLLLCYDIDLNKRLLERIAIEDPDPDYQQKYDPSGYIIEISKSDKEINTEIGYCGCWDVLNHLVFVEDHERKLSIIKEYIQKHKPKEINSNVLITLLSPTKDNPPKQKEQL